MSRPRLLSLAVLAASLAVPYAAGAQTTTTAPAAVPSASAPPASGHHHRHRRPSLMHALRGLNLTDAQRQQVTSFHAQEMTANKGADAATRRANAATFRRQVMGVLTPDQQAQLQTAMHRGRNRAPLPASATPAPQ